MTETETPVDPHYTDLFAALTEMTCGFVKLADPRIHEQRLLTTLDSCLEQGWTLRTLFAIGSAGALGWSLAAVSPAGQVVEIVNLDAPPSTEPFRLTGTAAAP